MTDRFGREIDLPDVAVGINVPNPPVNALSIYGRGSKLAYKTSAGTEVLLEAANAVGVSIDGGKANTNYTNASVRIDFGSAT